MRQHISYPVFSAVMTGIFLYGDVTWQQRQTVAEEDRSAWQLWHDVFITGYRRLYGDTCKTFSVDWENPLLYRLTFSQHKNPPPVHHQQHINHVAQKL